MFSEEEIKNLNDYIDRGGNLIIACRFEASGER